MKHRVLTATCLLFILTMNSYSSFAANNSSAPPVAPVLLDASSMSGSVKPVAENKIAKPSATASVDATNTDEVNASDEALFQTISNDTAAAAVPVDDPFEGYNRFMYKVNDHLDIWIAKPVARFYNKVMPQPLYDMADNFFVNIDTVPTVLNDVLQANFYQASCDSWHLIIDTTLGIGGLFDPAGHMGLKRNYSDFGLTMARWSWVNSSYFVIPILGPSTIRDAAGRAVTYEGSVYPWIRNVWWRYGIYAYGLLNTRAHLLKYEGVMDQAAIDPYVFMRNAYLQRRAYEITQVDNNNNPNTGAQMKEFYDPMYLYN